MDMLAIQGLLGLGFVGFGVYRFLNQDAARETQSRAKSTRAVEVWERRYITISSIGFLFGLFLIGASLISVFSAKPPVGEYICLPTNASSDDDNTFLVLQRDGTGSYDGLTLTWTQVNETPLEVIFGGQTDLVSGGFPVTDDPRNFVVMNASSERQLCLLR